jgi:hypothetical protein
MTPSDLIRIMADHRKTSIVKGMKNRGSERLMKDREEKKEFSAKSKQARHIHQRTHTIFFFSPAVFAASPTYKRFISSASAWIRCRSSCQIRQT